MSNLEPPSDFSPSDNTDQRSRLDWRTRYPDSKAQRGILFDACYLGSILSLLIIGFLSVWLGGINVLLHASAEKYRSIELYGFAWLGGTLGGTLFALKWLYHSVAKGWWNEDRRLWRIFTPHISGGLSFAVTALITSGLIRAFNDVAIKSSCATIVGISFLVGYFSDSAIAKLSELSDTIFGVVRPLKQRRLPGDSSPEGSA